MKHTHRIEIKSHPLHKDVHVRLWLKNGTTEILILKSNIYYHFKIVWKAAQTTKKHDHVVIQIHSEDGKLFHKTVKQLKSEYLSVIQVL